MINAVLPGKLLVVVLPGDGDPSVTTASFDAEDVPNLLVRHEVLTSGRSALDAANNAARAEVTYLAFVPAGTLPTRGPTPAAPHPVARLTLRSPA